MRLFIGLELPWALREAAREASAQYRRLAPGRYVEEQLFHITLAFLGEREETDLAPLGEILRRVASEQRPFPLALGRPGFFSRMESAILYLGLENAECLHSLSDPLRRELARAGQSFDPKPFRAHITLARKVNLLSHISQANGSSQISLPLPRPAEGEFSHLTLFHSTRVQGALRYLSIDRAFFRHED